jgi:hypothetical protein
MEKYAIKNILLINNIFCILLFIKIYKNIDIYNINVIDIYIYKYNIIF